MSTISTCIIVKNEINNIPGLVDDLRKFSDEIIIVDTGSDDGTLEWLQENQDDVLKLEHFEWINHFAKARNYSFSKATKDWIFWCDADDRISETLINDLCNIKDDLNNMKFNAYYINYDFGNKSIIPRIRLIKRSSKPYWTGACHEYVLPQEECISSYDAFDQENSLILHQRIHGHPERNLPIFINTIIRAARLEDVSTRDLFYFANELRDNGFLDKSVEVTKMSILREDMCPFDIWNGIVCNLLSYWISTAEVAKEGIEYIEKIHDNMGVLRGDVWYALGMLYSVVGDREKFISCCEKAITTDVSKIDKILDFGENKILSKITPAVDIYMNTDDDKIRKKMKKHLKKYINIPGATEVLEQFDIKI